VFLLYNEHKQGDDNNMTKLTKIKQLAILLFSLSVSILFSFTIPSKEISYEFCYTVYESYGYPLTSREIIISENELCRNVSFTPIPPEHEPKDEIMYSNLVYNSLIYFSSINVLFFLYSKRRAIR